MSVHCAFCFQATLGNSSNKCAQECVAELEAAQQKKKGGGDLERFLGVW